ncbi:MAG TPA: ABC transporter ATP-binding protein [Spirochaetes bacterium]|nr:ABC transporter ATP-binding protein [Spirochaetota bacterium]
MAQIEIKGIKKAFGKVQALDGVEFRVRDKEFFCLVGPTNAGKTTTLRIIAGLEKQDGGDVLFDDMLINDMHPRERDVAMLFQNLALYPNKTGFENIATPLRIKKFPDRDIRDRIHEVADILHIAHLLDRLPGTYSGGERQRVAHGRTIIRRPKVYLFDEPLSNLDAILRVEMKSELKRLQRELGQTMVFVTHDQVEAISMSGRVAVLHQGKIQQIGLPSEIFNKPANMFTAGFFGSPPMSFLKCSVEKPGDRTMLTTIKVVLDVTSFSKYLYGYRSVRLGIRPQHVRVGKSGGGEDFKVQAIEPLGYKSVLTFEVENDILLAVVPAELGIKSGDSVGVSFDTEKVYIFDEETNRVIV